MVPTIPSISVVEQQFSANLVVTSRWKTTQSDTIKFLYSKDQWKEEWTIPQWQIRNAVEIKSHEVTHTINTKYHCMVERVDKISAVMTEDFEVQVRS
jgi:hypothetical protein